MMLEEDKEEARLLLVILSRSLLAMRDCLILFTTQQVRKDSKALVG
jgi:hypothetical protein